MSDKSIQFKVENLGPLAMGTLNLADLTVICGENNTGKTYLTYAFYGLLRQWEAHIQMPHLELSPLIRYGVAEFDLQRLVVSDMERILKNAVETYRTQLPQVLASQSGRFDETHLELKTDFENDLKTRYYQVYSFGTDRRDIVTLSKPEDSTILTVTAATAAVRTSRFAASFDALIEEAIRELCFEPLFPEPFMLSAERTGAVMFQGTMNVARSRFEELAQEMMNKPEILPADFIRKGHYGVSYPLPVRDNIEFLNSLTSIQSLESDLLEAHPDILKDFEALIGGSYQMQDGVIYFVPKGTRGVRLLMSESSSAVRSLVILGYYLRHRAAPGDLLMIDEPELNLHPANQRRLARLLVRLVNAGVKVFVTTHSDYIIKEFNTLIMLNSRPERLNGLSETSRYTEKDVLDPKRIRVYMLREELVARNGSKRRTRVPTLCEANITPTLGAEVPSFDETIDDQNAVQERIYYGTKYTGTA